MVVAIPKYIKMLGGRFVRISITNIDSWRVRVTFKSDNGVSYEAISTYMYKLLDQPVIDSGISFERYTVVKKCSGGAHIDVSVNGGIATFRESSFRISTFTIGEPGEEYCKIPSTKLNILNKFLGNLKGLKITFEYKGGDFLFSGIGNHYLSNLKI